MSSKYIIIKVKDEWDRVVESFSKSDIYFKYSYFNLYSNEFKKPIMAYFESDLGRVAYPFMLKDISDHFNFKDKLPGGKYFDIATPFGYAGHLMDAGSTECSKELMNQFYESFESYCRAQGVISEFVRFSPLLENHVHAEGVMETDYLKKMVATDLQSYGDPLYGELTKSRRQRYNKAKRSGLTVQFDFSPKSLASQLPIYYDTMDRNNAYDFFYFSKEYFEKIISKMSDNVLVVSAFLDDKLIAFELCFLCDGIINAHVAGTLSDYLSYSPSDFIATEIITWGHQNGYKYYHAGGGTTSDPEDSLYRYKKSFSKNTEFDFYLGKKIWDQEVYNNLLEISGCANNGGSFFPLYRDTPRTE